jgi:hypothetical protein
MGWKEAADLVISSMEAAIGDKIVTYDFARLMEGATERCQVLGLRPGDDRHACNAADCRFRFRPRRPDGAARLA